MNSWTFSNGFVLSAENRLTGCRLERMPQDAPMCLGRQLLAAR
jgi:hypothetical protein